MPLSASTVRQVGVTVPARPAEADVQRRKMGDLSQMVHCGI